MRRDSNANTRASILNSIHNSALKASAASILNPMAHLDGVGNSSTIKYEPVSANILNNRSNTVLR